MNNSADYTPEDNPTAGETAFYKEKVQEWKVEFNRIMKEVNRLTAEIDAILKNSGNLKKSGISFEDAIEMGLVERDVLMQLETRIAERNMWINDIKDLINRVQSEWQLNIDLEEFFKGLE